MAFSMALFLNLLGSSRKLLHKNKKDFWKTKIFSKLVLRKIGKRKGYENNRKYHTGLPFIRLYACVEHARRAEEKDHEDQG
jgi:hypothetical protein